MSEESIEPREEREYTKPENSLLKCLKEEFEEDFWKLADCKHEKYEKLAELARPFNLSLLDLVLSDQRPDMCVAQFCGGENGPGNWADYFASLGVFTRRLQKEFGDAWLVKLTNDCPDDIHYAVMGISWGAGE